MLICLVLLFIISRSGFMLFFSIELEIDTKLDAVHHHLPGRAQQAMLPARTRTWWQVGVALLSMAMLVITLFAALSHQHESGALNEDDCIVCNLAVDLFDDVPVTPVAVAWVPLNYYYLLVATAPSPVDLIRRVAPSNCGPPPTPA